MINYTIRECMKCTQMLQPTQIAHFWSWWTNIERTSVIRWSNVEIGCCPDSTPLVGQHWTNLCHSLAQHWISGWHHIVSTVGRNLDSSLVAGVDVGPPLALDGMSAWSNWVNVVSPIVRFQRCTHSCAKVWTKLHVLLLPDLFPPCFAEIKCFQCCFSSVPNTINQIT